jgi:hypothetical protein
VGSLFYICKYTAEQFKIKNIKKYLQNKIFYDKLQKVMRQRCIILLKSPMLGAIRIICEADYAVGPRKSLLPSGTHIAWHGSI